MRAPALILTDCPNRAAVKNRLTQLITTSSPAYSALVARGMRVFARYSDPAKQQPMLVTLDAKADPASRKTLLDPNALDPSGLTAIDWFVPSGDGTKFAVSLSRNGSEDGTLHIFDVATGKEIGEPIDRVQYPTAGGSMAWTADSQGFWYTRYPGTEVPEADRHFYLQVYFHKIGAPVASDRLALGKPDGLERMSELFLDNRSNRSEIMAMVQRGDGNIWAFYVLKPGAAPVQVGTYDDQIVYATIGPDGGIYAISRKGASNGRVVKLAAPYKDGAGEGAGDRTGNQSRHRLRRRGGSGGRSRIRFGPLIRARHHWRPDRGQSVRSEWYGARQAAAAGDRRERRDRQPD